MQDYSSNYYSLWYIKSVTYISTRECDEGLKPVGKTLNLNQVSHSDCSLLIESVIGCVQAYTLKF